MAVRLLTIGRHRDNTVCLLLHPIKRGVGREKGAILLTRTKQGKTVNQALDEPNNSVLDRGDWLTNNTELKRRYRGASCVLLRTTLSLPSI